MRHILATGLLSLAIAGCGPVNRGVESVNQPVVSRADYVFDVNADGLASPDSAEGRQLDAWFAALRLGYGDSIALDDPAPYGHEGARATIAAILADHGMLLGNAAPVMPGSPVAGSIRVVVSRSRAEVQGCPNWSRPSQPEFAASTMSNYGCAVNANLAAMVANPEDLVRGQEAFGSDARSVTKAIQSYRQKAPTGAEGLKSESTTKGSK
ncbi:CpaD family pilus assembly protein [Sphingomonas fennica]|uniref:Pilus assembly protein CpaD n=1 Tax=Edaphosphingomonas fennica TaxID=114404 RepID=A0A2T4HNL3_9SPHN|nr:CpaD family pilus assembly protein [Sphingomonas fennica]PTD17402.1 hypothetical protein CV103_17895 [Sphingomonas fennica]